MTAAASAEALASGKGHRDENFPVARWLRPAHRAPILAFYRFARAADDVADAPAAPPAARLALLEAMRATIAGEGDDDPAALALRRVIEDCGLDRRHALDLLEAFRRDVTVTRYPNREELLDYCRYSAMPVGRFVLDVHGEDRALWPVSDALCAALQIINHLQDCAKDYRALDRVYLPLDRLAAAGATVTDLAAPRASAGLRATIAGLAEWTEELLAVSAPFARRIVDRRLGCEVAIIQRLAVSLAARLRVCDPLAERVHHRKPEAALLALAAVVGRLVGR
ncbi:MAG TPA: squalene synthase HpnC [Sphingomonadaceae bacterium]|nr:squalene synthase HpnC [Sphingomonadaceae bacterium]